jgi:hypothetical protein
MAFATPPTLAKPANPLPGLRAGLRDGQPIPPSPVP